MTKQTGGPAFPSRELDNNCNLRLEQGMTLRDYFAAKAMHGIVSTVPHLKTTNPDDAAIEAYEYADAMLKAREQ
jgi:hypothetical protein